MATVAFLVGLPVLYNYFRSRNSWIETDGKRVTTSRGQVVELEQVQGVDKRRWEKKGIAKVSYLDQEGVSILVIDDFKYERAPMGEILAQIEAKVDRDKIVGAPTQQELAAYQQEISEAGSEEDKEEAGGDSIEG